MIALCVSVALKTQLEIVAVEEAIWKSVDQLSLFR